jgi:hypothetical protein
MAGVLRPKSQGAWAATSPESHVPCALRERSAAILGREDAIDPGRVLDAACRASRQVIQRWAGNRKRLGDSPPNQRLKLTGAAILVFRASMFLQAAPAA